MAETALRLRPGLEPFPGYRLIQPIGTGAWSEVWKARRADGSACALKFMECRSDANTAAVEIRAIQGLRHVCHPNLLAIDSVWSCRGYIVLGMELADGSLLDLLSVYLAEVGPMSAEHVCYFLAQAALAIDFLNARKHMVDGRRVAFRHCDIKPGNLLVFGQDVKLADFSLSVQVTASTYYHRRCGTVLYSAPEVFQGWLSDRSDQYSLAITYYQLRTGLFPFTDTPNSFAGNYQRPAPDLSRVSAAEQEVLARALAHVPQDRWASCTEFMQRLIHIFNPPPVPAEEAELAAAPADDVIEVAKTES